jgi:hypothetical protein
MENSHKKQQFDDYPVGDWTDEFGFNISTNGGAPHVFEVRNPRWPAPSAGTGAPCTSSRRMLNDAAPITTGIELAYADGQPRGTTALSFSGFVPHVGSFVPALVYVVGYRQTAEVFAKMVDFERRPPVRARGDCRR